MLCDVRSDEKLETAQRSKIRITGGPDQDLPTESFGPPCGLSRTGFSSLLLSILAAGASKPQASA